MNAANETTPSHDNERFKEYIGFALTKLYDAGIPNPVTLVPSKIVAELQQEPTKANIFLCQRTLEWLEVNDYFKCASREWSGNDDIAERAFRAACLTPRGLTALGREVKIGSERRPIVDALREQLVLTAGDVRSAAISRIVEQFFSYSF
jgi:hypothetical protein